MSERHHEGPEVGEPNAATIVREAYACLQSGRLADAERLCRRALDTDPRSFDALALLGIVLQRQQRYEEANALLARASALRPQAADVLGARALVLRALGRHEDALALFDEALAIRPDFFEALFNRGNVLLTLERHREALEAFDRALAVRPDDAGALTHRGIALHELDRPGEALASHERALAQAPEDVTALVNRGNALLSLGRPDEALASHERALARAPEHVPAMINRGNALRSLDRLDEALDSLRRALARRPEDADALRGLAAVLLRLDRPAEALEVSERRLAAAPDDATAQWYKAEALRTLNRPQEALPLYEAAFIGRRDATSALGVGNALQALGRYEEALGATERALELDPELPDAWNNRGNALRALGRHEEALEAYQRAISLQPDDPDAHWNEGLTRLTLGDLEHGWDKYEWRTEGRSDASASTDPETPFWTGSEDLDDKSILLRTEQGFGDAIQFVRYAPLVAERGAAVRIACRAPLAALFRTVAGVDEVVVDDDSSPQVDYQAWLMSLPLAFATRLDSIPADVPYVAADPERVDRWRERLRDSEAKVNVGLAWRGNPEHRGAHTRDCPVEMLAPLLGVPGHAFFSLQLAEGADDVAALDAGNTQLVDLAGELGDFHETAAVLCALDLVICVDTAVAHLAGALGRPTWVLLQYAADWRWLTGREDSPWYPSLRLFRQGAPGDWEGAMERVVDELVRGNR